MAPTPLLTLLQQQLSECLMQGTSISESGLTVSTDKLSGEIILFFRIDSIAGRRGLGMEDLKVCDCLVFYAKENEQREMLCFLELKAAGLDKATQQILRMPYRILCNGTEQKSLGASPGLALKPSHFPPLHKIRYGVQILSVYRKVKQLLETNHIQFIILKVCICMRHQVPPGQLHHARELKRIFGPDNVHLKFGTRHYKQFGVLLRAT